jgi:hypothetical protein
VGLREQDALQTAPEIAVATTSVDTWLQDTGCASVAASHGALQGLEHWISRKPLQTQRS